MKGKIDPKALDRAVDRWLPPAVLSVEGQAKELAPVDTGNLRASIRGRVDGKTGIVGTGVRYAEYQEYGTRFFPGGNPFLRPAIDMMRKRLVELFGKIYREEAAKDGKS